MEFENGSTSKCSKFLFRRRNCRGAFFVLVVSTVIAFALIKTFDFDSVFEIGTANFTRHRVESKKAHKKKFAYVFYVTSSDYSCYALINVHRLIFDLRSDPKIDILVLTTESSRLDRFCPNSICPFPPGRLQIRTVSPDMAKVGYSLTNNAYYVESYVRFEAFSLYEEYERLIILDADGFLLKNIDHLFEIDLGSFNVAAALAHYLSRDWISSVLLVVEPSRRFYDRLIKHLNPQSIDKVSQFADGAHYDMDILNYILDAGNLTRRLSKYYALLDSYFFEDDDKTHRREGELNLTYYMHFTIRKPLGYHVETRPWPLEVNSANETGDSTRPTSNSSTFEEVVYYPFWNAFDKYCRVLVQRTPTVSPDTSADQSMSYPDPQWVMELINNSTDLMIAHL